MYQFRFWEHLTRLAYFSADYASFITENGALEGALAVFEPGFPSLKKIQNLAKFLVVIVCQVQVPNHKVISLSTSLTPFFPRATYIELLIMYF